MVKQMILHSLLWFFFVCICSLVLPVIELVALKPKLKVKKLGKILGELVQSIIAPFALPLNY